MKSIRTGVISAISASICCIGPLILIALGLGSLGIGTVINKYHWVFLAAGVLLIIFSWRKYFKEKKKCDIKKCQIENKRATLITLIIATAIVLSFMGLNLYTYIGAPINADQIVSVVGSRTIIIPVEGMTCFTCELTVSLTLKKMDGVIDARSSAKRGNVEVVYDSKRTNISRLIEAINKTGYKAGPVRL